MIEVTSRLLGQQPVLKCLVCRCPGASHSGSEAALVAWASGFSFHAGKADHSLMAAWPRFPFQPVFQRPAVPLGSGWVCRGVPVLKVRCTLAGFCFCFPVAPHPIPAVPFARCPDSICDGPHSPRSCAPCCVASCVSTYLT